jgi:hypothetical protein
MRLLLIAGFFYEKMRSSSQRSHSLTGAVRESDEVSATG